MLFLITGESMDNAAAPEAVAHMLENAILPSLQMLSKMEKEKKILSGGVYAGQRAGVMVVDMPSAEEVGKFLAGLPFWGLCKWNVVPLQTFESAYHRDKSVLEHMRQPARA